jgi:hypothetical protein
MKRLLSISIALLLLIAILTHAPRSEACGPFTLSAVFSFAVHPEYPLDRFAAGEIGVVQPTYARSYLVVAYRHLSDAGFSKDAQKGLVELWSDRLNLRWPDEGEQGAEAWLAARKLVPGIGPDPKIDVYRNREKPDQYETYLNCQNDAFRNAATTLKDRIAKFGADSPAIKDWVAAQDEVFANCGEGKHIPQAAPSESDPLIRGDRTYQIAAANFYAGEFADAKNQFAAIAQDRSSPWNSKAPYLLARTLIREASLNPPEQKTGPLKEAEKQLNAILNDPSQRENHAASKRLLNLVRLRLDPEGRVLELAQSLRTGRQDEKVKQDLWDYTILLDQVLGDTGEGPTRELPEALKADDLTDWTVTFQTQTQKAREHAIEKWQSTASLPWLVAAISKVDGNHAQARQLLSAASAISINSPAYPSLAFHSIRLTIETGRYSDARSMLDELLKHREQLTASGLNLALSQRMALATSLDDFLIHAPRVPAAFSYDDDGREIPADDTDGSEQSKALKGKALFDVDAAYLLNQQFPLAVLKEAAENQMLPPNLRRDVAQAAWVRAILLDDHATAEELVPTLKALVPEMSRNLENYLAAKDPGAKKFSGIYTWLKFPGLEPVVDAGAGREATLSEQDTYRDNWWCTAAFPITTQTEETTPEALNIKTTFDLIREGRLPGFLMAAQRDQGRKEFAAIRSVGAAPNYLCRETIAWANRNSADNRIPEALHLAVKTTRYGCTDRQSARWSKAAFDLLHRRYPRSVWTKRTPYWFKD